jgi:hypothetical protein
VFRAAVVCAVALAAVLPARAEFLARGVYWPQERVAWLAQRAGLDPWAWSERVIADLHDSQHCNLIWVVNADTDTVKRLSEIGAKHGVQVAGTPEPIIWWRENRTPEFVAKCAEDSVARFREAEGFGGYVLIDEPRPWEFPYLDAIRAELVRRDPSRLTLMVTMWPDTPAAISRTGFPIVTCDIYPFFADGSPNGPNPAPVSRAWYRLLTESYARRCQQAGKTFWVMPGAFIEFWGDWYYDDQMQVVAQPGTHLHWRMPTVGETRWQVWQGLLAGSKGVVFFVLHPPGNDRRADSAATAAPADNLPRLTGNLATGQPAALLNIDGSATPQLTAVGQAFADVERLERLLQTLELAGFEAVFPAPPLHSQTFHGPEGDLYAIVVSDSTEAEVTAPLSILPGIEGVRDLRADKDLPLALGGNSLQQASLTLRPGDGTVLHLQAPAARRPVPSVVEDFSGPAIAGTLDGARVRVGSLGWGVEKHEVVQAGEDPEGPPGTLTCEVARLTGDPRVHRPSGPIYLVYSGRGREGAECVELGSSTDGKTFERLSVDEFGKPIVVPRQATHLRFTIAHGGGLHGFYAVATEAPG